MILQTQMQKASILTIENGLFQAQYNGVVYQEYLPRFENIIFAGDAKHIFLAIKTLATSYKVSLQKDKLYLYDEEQEFRINAEIPDTIIEYGPTLKGMTFSSRVLTELKKFATLDFPAFFFCKDYIEVLNPSMIVRVENPYSIEGVYSLADLPVTDIIVSSFEMSICALLCNYSNNSVYPKIFLGALDLTKPDTTEYFHNHDPGYSVIPKKIKERWVPCDTAYFHKGTLRLGTQAIIEDVEGSGTYDGKLLAKVIRHADSWCFDGSLLRFCNGTIYGVLENIDEN